MKRIDEELVKKKNLGKHANYIIVMENFIVEEMERPKLKNGGLEPDISKPNPLQNSGSNTQTT